MDPTELRMNLSSLQRIDPYISKIVFSSSNVSNNHGEMATDMWQNYFQSRIFDVSQVALYDYDAEVGAEWVETKVRGTFFVYERKCEPYNGFLILNTSSVDNWIQPISAEIELQDKHPFLLYKRKVC